MTMYRSIKALQEPFDSGVVDEQGRAVVLFNVIAVKAPSSTFVRELVSILVAANVGQFGKTIIATSRAALPSEGTITIIIPTSGTPPTQTQNIRGVSYQQPTAQIRVHAAKYEDADAKARAAYDALTYVRNQDVTAA